MLACWWALSYALLGLLLPTSVLADHKFENTAVVRTVSPGGATVQVTTTFTVKALESGVRVYHIAFGPEEWRKTSWKEANLKGSSEKLPLEDLGFDVESGTYRLAVTFPKPLQKADTVDLILDTVQTGTTSPWPARAVQTEEQSLRLETQLFTLSPYRTVVQRTKIRSPTPRIISFSEPNGLDKFTTENAAFTRLGATLTYGPFGNIGPVTAKFLREIQQSIHVHYGYDHPVLEVKRLRRAAEISHWGANLNIQDEVDLHHGGPILKGHFSRLDYQARHYYRRPADHILASLTLHLPAGIRDVYYYDLVGNVSTSRLRIAPVSLHSGPTSYSVLELRPRYPLVGGWSYNFTLGWDAPLQDSTRWDLQRQRYIAGIPVLTAIPGAVFDDVEVSIVLPEGATDIEYVLPFPALSTKVGLRTTYLDTTGRPIITFKYERLTEKHDSTIYVIYKVPLSAHLKKPIAVATAILGLFTIALGWRRMDFSIHKK